MDWYTADWPYRRQITIDGGMISGNLTNFPFRFYLTGNTHISSSAHSGGKDFIFTTSDGVTRVQCENDGYLGGSGSFWVRAPSLSNLTDATFYLYYGEGTDHSQDDCYKPSGVWDKSSQIVYHLKESIYPFNDSTKNVRHIISGSATPPPLEHGVIGKWHHFDGASHYLHIPNDVSISYPYTVEVIAKPDIADQNGIFLAFGPYTEDNSVIMGALSTVWGTVNFGNDVSKGLSGAAHKTSDTYYFTDNLVNSWVAVNTNGSIFNAYYDGKEKPLVTTSMMYSNLSKIIGARKNTAGYAYYWDGCIDEVKFSNIIRTAGWLKTSFSSTRYPLSYVTLGDLEELSIGNTLFEYYNTNDDSAFYFYGNYWDAQTFTIGNVGANEDFYITNVKLKMFKSGSIGDVHVGIKETVGGLPTGDDLTSGSTDGNTLTSSITGEWRNVPLNSCLLNAGTQYALVVRTEETDINHTLNWCCDGTSTVYTGGVSLESNAGSTWTGYSTYDFMFEIYGTTVTSPLGFTGSGRLMFCGGSKQMVFSTI
jgi:hypothetical protein